MRHTKEMIISSQRYLDGDIVQAKRAARDYAVTLSPEFEIDGRRMQVVLDGHHSLAAARADGVEPRYKIAGVSTCDDVALLESSVDDFMASVWIDSDWYDVATGQNIF
ncbi:MAG: hypothetical protein PHC52_15000 [Syntrophales bacterium]|nr:hypothetical protein [Syntrophales bacterium]